MDLGQASLRDAKFILAISGDMLENPLRYSSALKGLRSRVRHVGNSIDMRR